MQIKALDLELVAEGQHQSGTIENSERRDHITTSINRDDGGGGGDDEEKDEAKRRRGRREARQKLFHPEAPGWLPPSRRYMNKWTSQESQPGAMLVCERVEVRGRRRRKSQSHGQAWHKSCAHGYLTTLYTLRT